jgi:hypothetical protein
MENFSNHLNQLPDPQERKFIKRLGLQNCRQWLVNKCGAGISKILNKKFLKFSKLKKKF